MKKISILFLTVFLLSQVGYASAEFSTVGLGTRTTALGSNSASRETIKTENQANLTANLKERAKREAKRERE